MKKKLKRLFINEKGSVSIFAIIIILPIFLLNALFIDTLRIYSAERQIENAMDTALRSTMAQFNEKLSSVGLFSYGGDPGSASGDFKKYVDNQFYKKGELTGIQNLSNPSINSASASFDTERNLVDVDVFKHQVLESMKYQAPAQLGQELFTLVSGISISKDDAKKVENLSESYEEIFKLAKKRNKKIDEAKVEIQKYIDMVDSLDEILGSSGSQGSQKEIPSTIGNGMEGLIHYNDRYQNLEKKENQTDDQKKEIKNYEDEVKRHARINKKKFNDFSGSREKVRRKFAGVIGEPNDPFPESAVDLNNQLREKVDALDLDNLDLGEEGNRELELLKKLPLEHEFFTEILHEAEWMDAQFDTNKGMSESEALNGNLTEFTIYQLVDGFYKVIKDHKQEANNIKNMFKRKKIIVENENHTGKIKNHLNAYEESKALLKDDKFKENEEKADKGYEDLWKIISAGNTFADDQENYDQLADIVAQYDAATGGDGDIEDKGKLQFIKDAFSRFTEFIDFMEGFPESFRNELYINEYIMANYGTNEPYELGTTKSYLYDTKNAEYITYGYHVAGMNYLMFIKDIAMVLFIVNLLEIVLMEGGFAGPIGFLRAVVKAFGSTVKQLKELTDKDFVTKGYKLNWRPFKIGKIEMTIPMFLRIFMMMKSTAGESYNNDKLRRLQAVITKDTDIYLDNSPSYLKGNVEGQIDLWFIPALTKLLPDSGGKTIGSVYKIKKEKVYSY